MRSLVFILDQMLVGRCNFGLAAQTGWLVISNKNKVRFADIHKEATRPFTGFN
jgi:hypothetical protein